MNEPIYSSNNEEGIMKSVGPYRIPTADMSISGVRLPEIIQFVNPLLVGSVKVYGTQIIIEQLPSPNQYPISK